LPSVDIGGVLLALACVGSVCLRNSRAVSSAYQITLVYDFCSYPFGLFSSTIISQTNPNNTIIQNIGWGTVINAFYLPGCLIGGLVIDRLGRRNTQMMGFFSQGVVGMILGGALAKIQTSVAGFSVIYGIFLSCAEAGPGIATYIA